MELKFATTNPTQLLGKGVMVRSWEYQVVAFSETSHTKRALPALHSEFRGFGFHLSCSDPVADKFDVASPLGSFRGLSKGVCLASLFPVFTPRPSYIPKQAWSSQRILYTVVQVHQVPIHVLTVYLFVNAPVGSHKFSRNCDLINWVLQIAETLQGPIVITGDMNISWRSFDQLNDLTTRGWADLHELACHRSGAPLVPTCKQATRHTFQFGNPDLSRFLVSMEVLHPDDLDSHSVLVGTFQVPASNPSIWKWMLPKAFDTLCVDHHVVASSRAPDDVCQEVSEALRQNDLSLAFGKWSRHAELSICAAATLEGSSPGPRYLGRAQRPAPVKRSLAAPRFKQGRATDFRVQMPSVALRVRQTQKQGRRLQCLERLMKKACAPCPQVIIDEVHQVWHSVVSATGFGKSFPRWVVSHAQLPWHDFPSLAQVSRLKEAVMTYSHKCSTEAWRKKKLLFNDQVEESWSTQGGSLPFRLMKDPQKPPVLDMTVQLPIRLAPQKWSPIGKAWVKVLNPMDYPVGATLTGDGFETKVVSQEAEFLQFDRLLSRREASSLFLAFVSTKPEEWTDHFLCHWSKYWNRPSVDDDAVNEVLGKLPSFPRLSLPPLCLADWKQALRSAKKKTMRGADGWSVQELLWLSDSFSELLLEILRRAEDTCLWPEQLSTWVLVLLRKTDDSCPTWSLIRPITIAGISYRIWSRVRTAQFLRHARAISKPLVSPCLSTRAIWTFLSDLISRKVASSHSLAGLVLDITKCFNILDRKMLRALMVHFGFPAQVVDCWIAMLYQLRRTVLVEGAVYGHCASSTGIPEGDPLSVVGMFTFAKAFDHFVQAGPVHSLCVTYADNWELVSKSAGALLRALPGVEQFLDLCQLPVSPSKCWFWAVQPSDRKRLRNALFLGHKVPVKLQARELGADISYCKRKAAKERNLRTTSGLRRLHKLAGLPGSVGRKTKLLVTGVFPHALHAAETSASPKSVLQRLRSGAALALGCRPKGSSPWLACLLSTYRCVDPEFILILNRIQLFRQVIRELPDLVSFFLDNLSLASPRPGPARLLVLSLGRIGWVYVGDGIFADEDGRIFHLLLTPLSHIGTLVLSTWTNRVASQVRHRKYLSELPGICVQLTQAHRHLLPFERKLILTQQVGAFYSGEFTKHIQAEAAVCPHCQQPDSRLHRLLECPKTSQWRSLFPDLMRRWQGLPEYITAFGNHPLTTCHCRILSGLPPLKSRCFTLMVLAPSLGIPLCALLLRLCFEPVLTGRLNRFGVGFSRELANPSIVRNSLEWHVL